MICFILSLNSEVPKLEKLKKNPQVLLVCKVEELTFFRTEILEFLGKKNRNKRDHKPIFLFQLCLLEEYFFIQAHFQSTQRLTNFQKTLLSPLWFPNFALHPFGNMMLETLSCLRLQSPLLPVPPYGLGADPPSNTRGSFWEQNPSHLLPPIYSHCFLLLSS